MRISDWSSDVCSSDLRRQADAVGFNQAHRHDPDVPDVHERREHRAQGDGRSQREHGPQAVTGQQAGQGKARRMRLAFLFPGGRDETEAWRPPFVEREASSEEHKSELPSTIRHSYAVVGVTKKT